MFSFIQADYVQKEHPEWKKMLNKVLKKRLKVKGIIWGISTKWKYTPKNTVPAYIDHQSASTEGNNVRMFYTEKELVNFLFSFGSYIQGGNDNK